MFVLEISGTHLDDSDITFSIDIQIITSWCEKKFMRNIYNLYVYDFLILSHSNSKNQAWLKEETMTKDDKKMGFLPLKIE
jgi:uncharacterized protein with NAD-binding domain and iron-sulfur cluster